MAIEHEQLGDQAASVLSKSRISRRGLFKSAGAAAGLTILFSVAPTAVRGPRAAAHNAQQGPQFPSDVDSYLRVNEDGTVTLYTGKVEFGQGIQTGFGQLIAEELSLPFERVNLVMGKTDETPFDLGTYGSLSTRMTGPRLRQAGAAMRQWLLELGAQQLGRDISELTLQDGAVIVSGEPGTSVSFAELAAGQRSERELDPNIPLKDPSQFTVLGQSIPRVDVPQKVNGELKYGIDVAVEGMVFGKIVRPPAFGATLESIDFSEAESMPGVVGVFQEGNFAGLAAERFEQAEAALAKVKATWNVPEDGINDQNIFEVLLNTADEGRALGDDTGPGQDVDIFAGMPEPLEVQFRAPYVNHTPIEPKACVVQVAADRVDVWSSTQDPFAVRAAVAGVLGVPPETVVVTPMAPGGAFGSKVTPMVELEAARLSKAFGRPVKVFWRREEEITQAQYRPAMLINIKASLDPEGTILAWQYDLYSSAYFPKDTETPEGAAADWSANAREIYDLTTAKTTWFMSQSPLPPFYWRVNGATTNTFAREVTMDILAERAGLDPVTFRRNHLQNNPRMQAVLDAVLEKSGWTPGVGQTGQGYGLALGFDANTYVAMVAQVDVADNGTITFKHADVAVDCGLIVNPEAAKHQIEGAVIQGTSATLKEMIRFENGQVLNKSFADYPILTMAEAPSVSVVFVEDKTQPMGGIGEPGVAPVAGAIANAVYDLVGVRLFETPFTPDRVSAAMQGGASSTPVVAATPGAATPAAATPAAATPLAGTPEAATPEV